MKAELNERSARVSVADSLGRVVGQGGVLAQAITNLISNGVKFVAPGVTPEVSIWTERRDERIRIVIADNGIGIAPEHQERIFGIFERLNRAEQYPGRASGWRSCDGRSSASGGASGWSPGWARAPASGSSSRSPDAPGRWITFSSRDLLVLAVIFHGFRARPLKGIADTRRQPDGKRTGVGALISIIVAAGAAWAQEPAAPKGPVGYWKFDEPDKTAGSAAPSAASPRGPTMAGSPFPTPSLRCPTGTTTRSASTGRAAW
jgi:hypothetical protein